jgi:GAF domain-containing protein
VFFCIFSAIWNTAMSIKTSLELNLQDRLRRLNEIGVALSAERDLQKLLRLILLESRLFTRADAGTLYLVGNKVLTFEITQNDTLGKDETHWEKESHIPPVPLDTKSASGYAALTGEIPNIDDVYSEKQHAFEGPKKYDQLSGYHTQSMLVVPMQDHDERVIAILQLCNCSTPPMPKRVPSSPSRRKKKYSSSRWLRRPPSPSTTCASSKKRGASTHSNAS